MIRARKKSRWRQKVVGGRVVDDRIYCTIVVKKILMLLIYILGKPLDEMALDFQHGRQTHYIETVQCQ